MTTTTNPGDLKLTGPQTEALMRIGQSGLSSAPKPMLQFLMKQGLIAQDGTKFAVTDAGKSYLRVEEKVTQWYKAKGKGYTSDPKQAEVDPDGKPIRAAGPQGAEPQSVTHVGEEATSAEPVFPDQPKEATPDEPVKKAAAKKAAKPKPTGADILDANDRLQAKKAADKKAAAPRRTVKRAPKDPLSPNVQKWGEAKGNAWLIRIPKLMTAWVIENAKNAGERKVAEKFQAAVKGKTPPEALLTDKSIGVFLTKPELQSLLALSRRMKEDQKGKDRNAVQEAAMRIKRLGRDPYNLDVKE